MTEYECIKLNTAISHQFNYTYLLLHFDVDARKTISYSVV